MSKYFTLKEICERLQINRKTVIRWIHAGRLKAFKLGGGRLWRVRERDLQAFIKGQPSQSQAKEKE